MQAKKGFTLIELLVVIAIIAILAAILFPVFANARDKARQISDLSNIKQIALSTIMYTNDYDDTYPIGNVYAATGPSIYQNWHTEILPYASTLSLFSGPNDTLGGQPSIWNGYEGVNTSYGANAFETQDKSNASWDLARAGIFTDAVKIVGGVAVPNTGGSNGTIWNAPVTKLSEITQPTATILFTDLQSTDDVLNDYEWAGMGNVSAIGFMSFIGNVTDSTQFNDSYDVNNAKLSTAPYEDAGATFTGYAQIPDASRPASAAYPWGPAGMVSTPFSSKTLTNVAYADGHAKAIKPVATNPDNHASYCYSGPAPAYAWTCGWDQNNQWIAIR